MRGAVEPRGGAVAAGAVMVQDALAAHVVDVEHAVALRRGTAEDAVVAIGAHARTRDALAVAGAPLTRAEVARCSVTRLVDARDGILGAQAGFCPCTRRVAHAEDAPLTVAAAAGRVAVAPPVRDPRVDRAWGSVARLRGEAGGDAAELGGDLLVADDTPADGAPRAHAAAARRVAGTPGGKGGSEADARLGVALAGCWGALQMRAQARVAHPEPKRRLAEHCAGLRAPPARHAARVPDRADVVRERLARVHVALPGARRALALAAVLQLQGDLLLGDSVQALHRPERAAPGTRASVRGEHR
eukprot:598109-Prorocentrum_minimum.AAC.1